MRKYRIIISGQPDVYVTADCEPTFEGCILKVNEAYFEFWGKIQSVTEI